MIQNKSYLCTKLAGSPYLLPYGQALAEHQPGIRLNETGSYLWKQLERDRSLEELIHLAAAEYLADATTLLQIREDITQFTTTLLSLGLLTPAKMDSQPTGITATTVLNPHFDYTHVVLDPSLEHFFQIGGLLLRLIGPATAIPKEFEPFRLQTDAGVPEDTLVDLTIELSFSVPVPNVDGTLLLQHPELVIFSDKEHYILRFPRASQLTLVLLCKSGNRAIYYCNGIPGERFRYELFHALRIAYLLLAQRRGMIVLHSSSILYQEKLWLFSGPSGTGKSTQAALWNTLCNTPILNGDLNLLCVSSIDSAPVGKAIPWCGTSGICDVPAFGHKGLPLGGIFLIKQASVNRLERLSEEQAIFSLHQRLISPAWTAEQLVRNLSLTEQLIRNVPIFYYHCTKEPDAVTFLQEEVDRCFADIKIV